MKKSLIIILFFAATLLPTLANAAKGVVVYNKPDCEHYIVQTNLGFALLQWFGGNYPNEGNILVGDFESFGMKDIYNITADAETRVWVEEFGLPKNRPSKGTLNNAINKELILAFIHRDLRERVMKLQHLRAAFLVICLLLVCSQGRSQSITNTGDFATNICVANLTAGFIDLDETIGYSNTSEPICTTNDVPEPTTISLLTMSLLLVARRWR